MDNCLGFEPDKFIFIITINIFECLEIIGVIL